MTKTKDNPCWWMPASITGHADIPKILEGGRHYTERGDNWSFHESRVPCPPITDPGLSSDDRARWPCVDFTCVEFWKRTGRTKNDYEFYILRVVDRQAAETVLRLMLDLGLDKHPGAVSYFPNAAFDAHMMEPHFS